QDLTGVCKTELHAGQRRADAAEPEAGRAVYGRRSRALGEAVALEDEDVQRVEELDDLLRQRRTARDADPDAAAQAVLDLLVDESIGQPVLEREPTRQRLRILAQPARLTTHAERPVDEPALDARRLGELGRDPRVDLLVDARHAREHRRSYRRQRFRDGVRVGAEGERVPD